MNENETSSFESEICKALESGQDVQEAVRKLVLQRLSAKNQDLSSLKRLTQATLRGLKASVQQDLQTATGQKQVGKRHLREGLTGLDEALSQFALASKLAIKEATSRTREASSEEYQRLRDDLERLDSMFLESLHSSALSAQDQASEIFEDFKAHLKSTGSKTGVEAKEALLELTEGLNKVTQGQGGAALSLAKESARLMCLMTAGGLEALSEHLKRDSNKRDK